MAKRPEPPAGTGENWIWTGTEQVSFDGATVYIQRAGGSRKGTSSFQLAQVSGVQLDWPSFTHRLGRFRIIVPGEVAPRRKQGAYDAVLDPFVVTFGMKLWPNFERFAQSIRDAQARLQQPVAPVVQQAAVPPPAPGLAAQLQQLGELHASGILSAAEFAAAKARLLGQEAGPQDGAPQAW